ncbi:MFS transporter [Acinetobacter larvae]|uniref:MFS transporter n=1 Tax=Acinetobacter larvae TaxID=1789224 RepID=A0A1B2M4F8_9GAMM|nr:MFS transporter [Acinetobacter larvae]
MQHASLYVLLFSLYWAQGLPVGFMTHALPVILRYEGVSLAHIGGFGVLMLPWAIKALWAPWVDRYGSNRYGHYRSWILVTQLSSVLLLTALAFFPIAQLYQTHLLLVFFIALLCLNSLGATQDIATDALAVHSLCSDNMHWGNMLQVIGSRLGFIVGGGVILWMLDWLNWQWSFLLLAALVLFNSIPILRYKEKEHQNKTQLRQKPNSPIANTTLFYAIKAYWAYFRHHPILWAWFWVLLSMKVTDGLSGPILKPLLVDLGLSLSQIGIYITMFGAAAALVGALLGSLGVQYLGRRWALLLFSVLKLASLAAFVYLAACYEQKQHIAPLWIYILNALEDLFSAMLLVVVLTLVMRYSRKQYAATDFSLQVSIMALVSGALYSLSGMLGDLLGYQDYLTLISLLGIVLLWPIYNWFAQTGKTGRKHGQEKTDWKK